jgi:hypothetical protein
MARNEKTIGYVLLGIGVMFLIFSIVEMLMVYSGIAPPPNLITLSDITTTATDGSNVTLIGGAQLSQLPNLFFWFVLMFFVLFAGGKIASLGVNMVKDIKVEVREPILPPKQPKQKNQTLPPIDGQAEQPQAESPPPPTQEPKEEKYHIL